MPQLNLNELTNSIRENEKRNQGIPQPDLVETRFVEMAKDYLIAFEDEYPGSSLTRSDINLTNKILSYGKEFQILITPQSLSIGNDQEGIPSGPCSDSTDELRTSECISYGEVNMGGINYPYPVSLRLEYSFGDHDLTIPYAPPPYRTHDGFLIEFRVTERFGHDGFVSYQHALRSEIIEMVKKATPLEFHAPLCPTDMNPKTTEWVEQLDAYTNSKILAKMDPMDIGFSLSLNLTDHSDSQDSHIESIFKLYDVFVQYLFSRRDRIEAYRE